MVPVNTKWVENVKSGAYQSWIVQNMRAVSNEYPPFRQNRAGRLELQRSLAPLGNLIALDVHSTIIVAISATPKVWLKPSKKFARCYC